jgi:hypothetical protein
MLARDGDAACPANYVAVPGILKGVGRRVQVYAASEDLDAIDPELIKDVITVFDDRIFPLAARRFGVARDVDGDGRYTILLSSWLEHLGGGRHAVDGFVRVSDLDLSVAAPFGNRCDMMYLNTALRAGPYLRTVVAHEYMHSVTHSQKTLEDIRGLPAGLEEEGWLDEAIAHLFEDLHGFSTENIDYRISAFLSRPEMYELVVDDYFAADLFRSHGHRGSTYLFLRWCVDRYGPDLLPAIVQSHQRGIANLEAATGSTFAALFRRWSLALYQSGNDVLFPSSTVHDDGYRTINMRAPRGDWELAGPRCGQVVADGPALEWQAMGTSSHFASVLGSTTGAVEIEVSGPVEAQLQVTAVPLGADRARLELSLQPLAGPGGDLCVRAQVAERHGVPVRLSALCWEPLTPAPTAGSRGARQGSLDMLGIASVFGTSAVPARGELSSGAIRLTGIPRHSVPLVVKLIGTDARGHRVSAWADLNTSAGDP